MIVNNSMLFRTYVCSLFTLCSAYIQMNEMRNDWATVWFLVYKLSIYHSSARAKSQHCFDYPSFTTFLCLLFNQW